MPRSRQRRFVPDYGISGEVVNLRRDRFDVYIGRARGRKGVHGNPVRLDRPCPVCLAVHSSRGDTLSCYERWLHERLLTDPEYRALVCGLVGRRLGCFCAPSPCHGYPLLGYATWLAPMPDWYRIISLRIVGSLPRRTLVDPQAIGLLDAR